MDKISVRNLGREQTKGHPERTMNELGVHDRAVRVSAPRLSRVPFPVQALQCSPLSQSSVEAQADFIPAWRYLQADEGTMFE